MLRSLVGSEMCIRDRGLAISRQIIESHGGQIFAENRYDGDDHHDSEIAGARFTAELPMH